MKNLFLSFILQAIVFNSYAMVIFADDDTFYGYLNKNDYIGVNNKSELLKIPLTLEKFTKDQIEDLYGCAFQAMSGENVGFMVLWSDDEIREAGCNDAPFVNFRQAWTNLVDQDD